MKAFVLAQEPCDWLGKKGEKPPVFSYPCFGATSAPSPLGIPCLRSCQHISHTPLGSGDLSQVDTEEELRMPTQGHLPGGDSASLGTWFGEAVGVKPGIHAPEARVESGLEVQSMCGSGNVEAIWKRG